MFLSHFPQELPVHFWQEPMQAPEELAAKFQAAMGNRSCSTQSFEDKFPGVFIRKKKRRDMDRCLSQNSMDSWVSETEQPEEMPTWFMNNPSPPSSPTKKPPLSAAPVRHPVDRSMIPVMSMDCLDEANVCFSITVTVIWYNIQNHLTFFM